MLTFFVSFVQVAQNLKNKMMTTPMIIYAAQPAVGSVSAVAATTSLAAVGAGVLGVAAGAALGLGMEMGLQEFEEKFKVGTFKMRWWTAQGIRTLVFGTGVGVSVATAFGLIAGGSLIAGCAICSGGITLAICAAVGIAFAIGRYKKGCAEDKRRAIELFILKFEEMSSDQRRMVIQEQQITIDDIHHKLKTLANHNLVGRIYGEVHRLSLSQTVEMN